MSIQKSVIMDLETFDQLDALLTNIVYRLEQTSRDYQSNIAYDNAKNALKMLKGETE